MNLSDSRADPASAALRLGAAESVLSDLRTSIESGAAPIGSRLPSEATLASQFGVSRSAVREALRSTTALGLTETHTGKGTFVVADTIRANPMFGDHSVESLREARPHIEVPAAALAAVRRSDHQMAAIRTLFDDMVTETDPRRWVRLDAEFHLLIAQSSGNDVFAAVIGQIRDALAQQSELVNLLPDRQHRSNVEHRAIVDAIDAGSSEDAAAAMTGHLERVQDALGRLRGN